MHGTIAFRSMKAVVLGAFFPCLSFVTAPLWAQDLGPNFRKIKDGIYVQSSAR